MTISESVASRDPLAAPRGHHPGLALAVIAASQLMVVLDATIVNIALPHIQSALHFSTTSLSWVLNAYTLTFGGLLLLGGRAGDILGRLDLAGAFTSTTGMLALVYGFIRAAQQGWSDNLTIGSFVAAVVLLAAFVAIERRTRQPITPLHMFTDRNRAGSYAIMFALAAALFGMFFFLTLFVQNVLGYSPLRAGVAFLPVTGALILTSQFAARSLPRLGPKRLLAGAAELHGPG